MLSTSIRTHSCNELNEKDVKKKVKLGGFIHAQRDHGGLIFIDLRDRYGITQIVFDPKDKKLFSEAEKLRREYVIVVSGVVRVRPKDMTNNKIKTGGIEVLVNKIESLNRAEVPPIEIDDRIIANEDTRLKYRYLDLRRPIMQRNFIFRHNIIRTLREFLDKEDFLEMETPMLVKPTPEGARDYIVPSRVNSGKFYALPQSPQIYKQILMISGFDRYYQIARCLRDEDLRADRQPEHTQLDLEMSFVNPEDVFELTERMIIGLFKKVLKIQLKNKFPRILYSEAMEKYGTDKPDLRYEMFQYTITDLVKNSDFQVFKNAINNGAIVKCLCVDKAKDITRNQIDAITEFAKLEGALGLAWVKIANEKFESNINKYFSEKIQKDIIRKVNAKDNDLLLFTAETPKKANSILDKVRQKLAKDLNRIRKDEWQFCFVTDFPLFEFNEETESWDATHNPFTLPKEKYWDKLEDDPGSVSSYQYDFVLNGCELFSGSIRNNIPELQEKVLNVIGISKDDAWKKFGFLMEAYRYGSPRHAGFGLGLDRLIALMLGYTDIREVIVFPKNKNAQCPMDGSPSDVDDKQLKELNIKLELADKSR